VYLPPSITGHGDTFVQAIESIERQACRRARRLVIRDWSHVDFMGVPFLQSPPGRPMLAEVLGGSFSLVRVALVRHPIDQWLSSRSLVLLHGQLTLATYLRGYRMFAEMCRQTGFVRYEDFSADPVREMGVLCERLQLDFDPGFLDRWSAYTKITGDADSRGTSQAAIRPLPRLAIDDALMQQFRSNEDYRAALDLLGYRDPQS
jgi:hypothetical protein